MRIRNIFAKNKRDFIIGAVFYPLGDLIGSVFLNSYSLTRTLGLVAVGALIYAIEIPAYFAWIERRIGPAKAFKMQATKTLLAALYFNPIWIFRHAAFIAIFSGAYSTIGWGLLSSSLFSFLYLFPVSICVNHVIQNWLPLRYRFFASSIFSVCVAVYYALSTV